MDTSIKVVHPLRHSPSVEDCKYANVCVLYTGGTIGMSRIRGGGLKPKSNMATFLKTIPMLYDKNYIPDEKRKKPDIPSEDKSIVELVMPLSEYGVRIFYYLKEYELKKDSSDMDMSDWVDIAIDVKENYHKFDSFVILHGTDTMAYTASVLSFMFQNLDKPVILTGSQVPIFEQRNDGCDNLLGALMIAAHFVIPEVTLFFHQNLYRGNRTTKINSGDFPAFDSPNLLPLATLKVRIDVHWDAILRCDSSEKFEVHTDLNPNVGLLRLFPGITDTTVESMLCPPKEGVVLETFGAGNCPSTRSKLIQVLKEAIDRGVIIVNCTQCLKGSVMVDYETGQILDNIGVLSCSDITPEAALTKLSYVLGHKDIPLEEKKKMIQTNLRGEMTVAVVESQFSLKDCDFIRVIASTLHTSSAKEMHYVRKAVHPLLICSAAQSGELEVMDELCQQKGDVNCSLEYDERTPLHIAAATGNIEMVKKLLQHGASLRKVNKYGATPLIEAVRFKRKDVIRLFIQSGAYLGPVTMSIASDICVAAASGDIASLEAWYLAGVDLNAPNSTGRTPLHEAVCALRKKTVEYLLSCNVNTDVKDNLGSTALENVLQLQKILNTAQDQNGSEKKTIIEDIISLLPKTNV